MNSFKNFIKNSHKAAGILLVAFVLFANVGTAQNRVDAALVNFTSPTGAAHTGLNKTLSIRIRNTGNVAITSMKFQYRLNGGAPTEVTRTVSIPVASNTNQIPTATVDITATNGYVDALNNTVQVNVLEVNSQTDVNPINDTVVAFFGTPITGAIKTIGIGATDYKTITQAINDLRYRGAANSITFKIKGGAFTENMDLNVSEIYFANTASKSLTFESESGLRDVLIISESAQQTTVRLNGIDDVTLKNLRVINKNIVTGIGIQVVAGADNVTIRNCEVTVDSISNTRAFVGICATTFGGAPTYSLGNSALAGKNLTIINNKISGGYYGIAMSSGTGINRDIGNRIEGNIVNQTSYYGIYVNNNTNATITKNKVTLRPSADIKSTAYFISNLSTELPGGIEISKNYSANAGQYGIFLNSIVGLVNKYANISNNMVSGGFYNNFSAANFDANNTPVGLYMTSSPYTYVCFNSVYMDAPTKTNIVDNTTAFYVSGNSGSGLTRVYNNIFYNANKGYAYYNASGSGNNPVTLSDNNDLFVALLDTNANPTSGFSFWNGAARTNLRDLKIASSGRDGNSISKDPFFFSKTDLHTLAIDLDKKGSTVPLTLVSTDYDNQVRDQGNPDAPDIGCDEFGPGGEDFAIIGVTPDVFKFNKPTPWNITVRYQGPTNGNKLLYFKYKINGVEYPIDEDSVIKKQFTFLSSNFKTQTFTVDPSNYITRTDYQSFQFCVYIYANSNVGDTRAYNDTLCMDVCVGLEGIFTIDKTAPPNTPNTFNSFQQVYDYLKCGVSGPTVFEIQDGTYDEQITFWKVRNSSAVNNITFKSKNNLFDTKLTYVNGTAENHATVLFNNAQYITLRDLTIENRSIANGTCIQLAGNSKFNTIRNNIIRVDSTIVPFPTTLIPIVSSRLGTLATLPEGINSQNNYIFNNKILGGYYGVAMFGQDTDQRDLDNIIEKNTIASFHKTGIYLKYADTRVKNNLLTGKFGMDNNAIAIYGESMGDRAGRFSNEISGNRIYDITWQGIYLFKCFGLKDPPNKKSNFVVSNNMIGGGFTIFSPSTCGIKLSTSKGIGIIHNTVYMDAPRSSTTVPLTAVARCLIVDQTNEDIEALNNILYSKNGAICMEYFARQGGNTSIKTGLVSSEGNLYYTTYANKQTPLILILRLINQGQNNTISASPQNGYNFSQQSSSAVSALTQFKNANTSRDRKSLALPIQFEAPPYDLHSYDLTVESKAVGGLDILDDFDKELRKSKTPDIGCDEFTVPNYDLEVKRIVNPILSAVKPNKVVVELRSRGRYSIENVKVALKYTLTELEGGIISTGIDTVTLTMKKTNDAQIYTFKTRVSVPRRGSYELCVEKLANWLVQDTVKYNDKACRVLCTGVEGNYYIKFNKNNPLPNTDVSKYYSSIQECLNNIECGIADFTNIYLNKDSSPYLERVVIPKYLVNLDSPLLTILPYNTTVNTDVVLQQPASPTGDPDRVHYTVRFNGANFVRLRYLNIKNTGVSFGSAIHFTRNAQNNIVEGCKIEVNNTSTSKLFYPIAFTSSIKLDMTDNLAYAKNGSGNRITKNQIIGGYASISMIGATMVDYDLNNTIDSNTISDYYQTGIFSVNNSVKAISFNSITPRSTSPNTAVSISYTNAGEGGIINANKIYDSRQIGIKLYGVEGTQDNRFILSNNWITNNFGNSTQDSASAIYFKRNSNVGVYYNSIRYNGFGSAIVFAQDSLVIPPSGSETTPRVIYFNSSNIEVKNNIVKVDSVAGALKKPFAIYFTYKDPTSEFNHNSYFTEYPSKFAFFDEKVNSTFGTWVLNSAKDLTSYYRNPLFVSATDLRLTEPDSINFDKKGVPVEGISRDHFNRKRNQRITDIGSIEYESVDFDASLLEIVNKKAVYGTNEFTVKILNDGYKDISDKSIILEYSVDSGITWIGTQTVLLSQLKGRYDEQLFTFNLKHQKNNFTSIPLCVRIVPSGRLTNDTITKYEIICKDLCVGLNKGIYTIGKNGTELFSTFTEAVNAIICGFDSSIVFKVSPGTYNERFSIPDIATSSTVTVKFESSTGNAKDVILQYTNQFEDLDHHVAQLISSKYITFKSLTFKSVAKARASGVHLADSAKFNTIEDCIFQFDSTSNINTLVGVLASGRIAYTDPGNASSNTVRNCVFQGGAFGVRLIGTSENRNTGATKVIGNKFRNNYTAAIDILYSQMDSLSLNDIDMRKGNYDNVGINVYGTISDILITDNRIKNAGNSGIVLDDCNTLDKGLIANNMVAGGFVSDGKKDDAAIFLKNTGAFPNKGRGNIDIINNSVIYDGLSDSAAALKMVNSNSMRVYNNIFANYGKGYAVDFKAGTSNVTEFAESNSNLLFTKGTNLARWKDVICQTLSDLGLQDNGNSPFNVGKSPKALGEFDPLFRSNFDLHVNNPSLDNGGVYYDLVLKDIDGENRNPTTPDVGCDEFFFAKDIGVTQIITPINNSSFKDTVRVIVKVKNYGDAVNVVKVKYSFDGVVIDSNTKQITPIDLKTGDSTIVVFNKLFSTRQAGPHILRAYTEIKRPDINNPNLLINEDFNPLNDTVTVTVISKDTSDIGISYFESPRNGIVIKEKTDVIVAVTNYGNLVANNFSIKLKVNNKVKENLLVNTPLPGKTTELYKFNYVLDPETDVNFEVCAQTSLFDDVLDANDSDCVVIGTVGIVQESAYGTLFNIHPNPTNSELNYGLDLKEEQDVTIQVYDLSGRLMKSNHVGILPRGKNNIKLNYEDLAEGTYLFVLNAGDAKYNGRFVIIK